MRILMVITGLGIGGAERVVVSLADDFASLGHDVRIVYMMGAAEFQPNNPNVTLVSLGITSKFGFFKAFFKLRKHIVDFQPDVVHAHMFHANIITRLVRIITWIPRLICTAHSGNEGGKLRMLAYRITDFCADISTNVSDSAVKEFIEKGALKPGRMISIYNGINTDEFAFNAQRRLNCRRSLSIDDDYHMLLAVGRLDQSKDYPTLFRSLSLLPSDAGAFKLFIAGNGVLMDSLNILVDKLNLNEKIIFLGSRYDVVDLMCAADIFISSSAWEGFGLAVAEAMSCECIVVATDCGGIMRVVEGSGFLVPPHDPMAMAASIINALHLSSSCSAKKGLIARQRIVDLYSTQFAVKKWLELYSVKLHTPS